MIDASEVGLQLAAPAALAAALAAMAAELEALGTAAAAVGADAMEGRTPEKGRRGVSPGRRQRPRRGGSRAAGEPGQPAEQAGFEGGLVQRDAQSSAAATPRSGQEVQSGTAATSGRQDAERHAGRRRRRRRPGSTAPAGGLADQRLPGLPAGALGPARATAQVVAGVAAPRPGGLGPLGADVASAIAGDGNEEDSPDIVAWQAVASAPPSGRERRAALLPAVGVGGHPAGSGQVGAGRPLRVPSAPMAMPVRTLRYGAAPTGGQARPEAHQASLDDPGDAGSEQSIEQWPEQGSRGGGVFALRSGEARGQGGQQGNEGGMGVVMLDGHLVGQWLSEHMAREASRPSASTTFFDPRQSPAWSPSGSL